MPSLFFHYYYLYHIGDASQIFGGGYFRMCNNLVSDFPLMKLKDSYGSWSEKWFYLAKPQRLNLYYTGHPTLTESFNLSAPKVQLEEVGHIVAIKVLSGHHLFAQAVVWDFLENRVSPLRSQEYPFFR